MISLSRKKIEDLLYQHAHDVLTENYIWETATVTKRKNREIVFGQLRNTLDRGRDMRVNSLIWGLKVYLKEGFMVLSINAEHAWIIDPNNGWHRRRFMEYFWEKITKDEFLMANLAMSELDAKGKIMGLRFM